MKDITVEGGEIQIENSFGDKAIIPKEHVAYVDKLIKDECWTCLDQFVDSLPENKDYAQDGTIVSELYTQKMGKDWSTAKAEGLTDGSLEGNMRLRDTLLSQDNTPKTQQTKSLNLSKATNFNEAFKIAREAQGPNTIFEFQGKKYGTNLEGEEFTPSPVILKEAGMLTDKVAERLERQNRNLNSPYTTKKTVKLESSYKDWNEVKKDNEEFNKMTQADRIVSFKNKGEKGGRYAIVDKKQGMIHLYESGNSTPIFSSDVGLGENKGDAQTVTKVKDLDGDGKISKQEALVAIADFAKGNKQTGAGKFYISGISKKSLGGVPSLTLMNEEQNEKYLKTGEKDNVSTAFHNGIYSKAEGRVSNGCVRCNKTTLIEMSNKLQEGAEVYILPEEEGNEFVLENGKLNFRVRSKNDYQLYTDSRGEQQKGQGINRTKNTLNYRPISITLPKDNNTTDNKFAQTLVNSKKSMMQKLAINGDIYNEIALLSMGILGQESDFGQSSRYKLKEGAQGLVTAAKKLTGKDSSNSRGLTQIKISSQNESVRKLFKDNGITEDNLSKPENAALASVIILAHMYNNELKDTKLLRDSNVEWQDALLYLYQGKKRELINKTATPTANNYISNVKNYRSKFKLKEKV